MEKIDFCLASKHYCKSSLDTANYFRQIAMEIDENPGNIREHLNYPGIKNLCFDRNSTCLDRTKLLEALSYGDAGVLLACPGPSLSGLMLRELGSEEQKNYFFDYVESNKALTFLAVTEPNKGSDASQMQTTIKKINEYRYIISGEKWLVGHGADAKIGVLVARTSSGPLGITAILLTPEILNNNPSLKRDHLDVVGLRGARLSRLVFNDVEISKEHILGHHLSPIKRGMMAVMKTFNQMRPGVAAFAIGHAQAILDYLVKNIELSLQQKKQIELLNAETLSARLILYKSAEQIDKEPLENVYGSLSKVKATAIAEKTTHYALQILGKTIISHPLLTKWHRDAYGYEYMEGTSHIQLKNLFQGFINKKFSVMLKSAS